MSEWTEKKVPKPEPKKQPLIRFARTPAEILAVSYVIPKDSAPQLLEKAIRELYPEMDVDLDESIEMSVAILNKINQYMAK